MKMVEEEIMQEGECSYNESVAIDVNDAAEHSKDVVLGVDLMVNLMEKKLASTRGKPSYTSTIFRVPEDVRNYDAAAYSPKVVSIGLLQQQGLLQQEKRRLDEHKWHYLDKVLSSSKNNLKTYTKEMANMVVKAGFCYSGRPEPGGMKDSVEIMLVDGCFIVNLLLQLEDIGSVEINDPIYSDRWTLPWVAHDMLLLENQLPFFVLEKLWELTGRERSDLKTIVLRFFRNLLPEHHDLELPEREDVHHLLHLIHLSLQPATPSGLKQTPPGLKQIPRAQQIKPESTGGTTIPNPLQPIDTLSSTKNSFEIPKPLQLASPIEKPESASGTTIPSPPQPRDTLSTSNSSSFESTESLEPTSCARISQSALSPHDEFPIPSCLEQILRGLKQILTSPSMIRQSALPPHDEFPIRPLGSALLPHVGLSLPKSAFLPHDEFPIWPSGTALLPHDEFLIPSGSALSPHDEFSRSALLPHDEFPNPSGSALSPVERSALLPHDEFPIPSGSALSPHDEFSRSALLPHDEFPIPSGSPLSPHDEFSRSALLPHDEFPIPSGSALSPHDEFPIPSGPEQIPKVLEQIPRAQQIKQMSEPRPAPPPKTIPSAAELKNAGVKFRRIKKARSFLDVTFEQGKMKMPRLTISDSTNSLFRNLIAFEQGFPDCGSHFTSYCIFMDSLINTAKDVEILKRAGIIEHVLGSDKEVAFLFNNLCKGTTWDFKKSYLAKVFEDVIQHSQKRWPRWRAKLVRDYFSNPWAILSSAAAIFVIIVTIGQTFFAVFSYFRPHGPNSIVSGHEIIAPAISNSFWI